MLVLRCCPKELPQKERGFLFCFPFLRTSLSQNFEHGWMWPESQDSLLVMSRGPLELAIWFFILLPSLSGTLSLSFLLSKMGTVIEPS